ncbi:hypothetical protein LX99_00460 [Mucilaginibacter oryzae]|uniref:Uncharacterized protein n=1 Tax=Mucilaginibacter oryzae TaxID=468058 RepID=A0A316HFJ5_9SPHI|nr:hypothetical protein [Mucilaginibacter oryzae]PWK79999.1 hypothetical protein LX99_00460 [Mucilaginibacter oryzae]
MQNSIVQYIVNNLSVGNWAQNLAFYTFIVLLSWVLIVQVKTARLRVKRKRTTK